MARITFQHVTETEKYPCGSIAVFEDKVQVAELPLTSLGVHTGKSRKILKEKGFTYKQAVEIARAAQHFKEEKLRDEEGKIADGFDLAGR